MANEVATAQAREVPEIVKFGQQLEQRAAQLQAALPGHITPEKFQRTLITAAQQNPDLLKADRQSLVLACMKAAQDGLVPDGREAALVIFKENKKVGASWETRSIVQYMPMVYGLRKKILQSGEVSSLEVNVVYAAEVEAGKFLYEVGMNPPLRHRPMLDLTDEQATDDQIVAAYSIATMKDGTQSFELMRRFEINKVRQVSKTGAVGQVGKFGDMRGKPIDPKGPWVDWFPEMAKKTVVRRHTKSLPMSGDLIIDVEGREIENAQSAAALLSRTPDAPQIEDQRDGEEQHDQTTGEIITGDGSGEANEMREAAGTAEKPKRRTKAQIAADEKAEREADAAADAERARLAGEASDDDQSANGGAVDPAADDSALDEDAGHPAEGKAEQIIAGFKAATLLMDLNRLRNESTVDVMAMPDELAERVDNAYRVELKRLQK